MNPADCKTLYFPIPPPCGGVKRANCNVELCGYATRIREAVHLIQLGARAGLVCQLTHLEKAAVNRLYRELHGVPSPQGQTPFTDTWYRENDLPPRVRLVVTVFCNPWNEREAEGDERCRGIRRS